MDIGGNGIGFGGDGFNSSGSFSSGGSGSDDVRLTVEIRVTATPTVNRSDVTWTGPYDKLLSKLHGINIGSGASAEDFGLKQGDSDSDGDFGPCRYSGAVLTRTPGGRGRLVVSVVQTVHHAMFGIDFVEVSKPIMTWHADKEEGKPDLAKIKSWQDQKDGNLEAYNAFKIGDESLENDTLKLAQMIHSGIETYSLYAPVFTISMTVDQASRFSEAGNQIGTIGDPACPFGWKDAKGRTADEVYGNCISPTTGVAYEWLLVKSTITPNADGTHQWNLAWQGADSIESKLYSTT